MRIAISTETTNDLSWELLQKYDVKVVPLEIVLGDKVIKDGDITVAELFEFVRSTGTLPKTNAINEFMYEEHFAELRKEYDAIVHIALSSGISSSCGNAQRASKNVDNVYVVDSQSLTTGIGLLCIYARELAQQGLSAEEIAKKVSERTKSLQVSFVLERLDFMRKGGRCSSVELLGANVFKIRPSIIVKDGVMRSDKKYRGAMNSVIEKYCQDTLATYDNPDLERVFLTYTTATPEMLKAAHDVLASAGFKNICEAHARGTVASHCGDNTMGIIYFNDGGNK